MPERKLAATGEKIPILKGTERKGWIQRFTGLSESGWSGIKQKKPLCIVYCTVFQYT
jgi:hypothetical protein